MSIFFFSASVSALAGRASGPLRPSSASGFFSQRCRVRMLRPKSLHAEPLRAPAAVAIFTSLIQVFLSSMLILAPRRPRSSLLFFSRPTTLLSLRELDLYEAGRLQVLLFFDEHH
jgi:hypothetical protein